MRVGNARAVVITIILALSAVAGAPVAAHAQVTCTQGTAALVRAVGPAAAPIQVPAQVHVTICSQGGNVVAVIPAFTTVGPANAPLIIPQSTLARTCAPTVVASTPVSGGGLTPPLQFVQVGSGVFAVNLGTTGTAAIPVVTTSTVTTAPVVTTVIAPTVITSTPTAFTCF